MSNNVLKLWSQIKPLNSEFLLNHNYWPVGMANSETGCHYL